jgi:hypothetical protein
MSQDDGGDDPLLRAIREFRQELIAWIDVQLGSLRESASAMESRIEPLAPRTPAPISTRSVRQDDPDAPLDGTEKLAGRVGGLAAAAKREPIVSTALSQDARLARSGPGDHAEPADARGRLDALARQLGERLRSGEAPRKPSEHTGRPVPNGEKSGETH